MTVFEKIEKQRKGKENSDVWMVGQQLLDIIREEGLEELVAEVIDTITLQDVAGEIKAYADRNHGKERFFCVPPHVAEGIIREAYGLPEGTKQAGGQTTPIQKVEQPKGRGMLNLEDFL